MSILLTDPAGFIKVVNSVTESWFGYRESELAGKSIETIISLESKRDGASHPTCFSSQLREMAIDCERELTGKRKDGTTFPIRVTLHPVVSTSGDMILANVTNLSEVEIRVEKRIARERLAAMLEMVSGLSHESGNALHRAQSCLDLLELDLVDRSELLDLTERIRMALRDMHDNYEEVKEYAAPIVLSRSLVNVSALCQTAFDELHEVHAAKLHLRSIHTGESVSADPQQMTTVFREVLENAIHAAPARSVIDFACQNSMTQAGDAIEITIRDHGTGLSDETAIRMFKPFFTTKQRGTGLGLAVCRRIVEAHGGTIKARNHPDGGTIVQIVLPK